MQVAQILMPPEGDKPVITVTHDQIWFWDVRITVTDEEFDRLSELGVHWDEDLETWTVFT